MANGDVPRDSVENGARFISIQAKDELFLEFSNEAKRRGLAVKATNGHESGRVKKREGATRRLDEFLVSIRGFLGEGAVVSREQREKVCRQVKGELSTLASSLQGIAAREAYLPVNSYVTEFGRKLDALFQLVSVKEVSQKLLTLFNQTLRDHFEDYCMSLKGDKSTYNFDEKISEEDIVWLDVIASTYIRSFEDVLNNYFEQCSNSNCEPTIEAFAGFFEQRMSSALNDSLAALAEDVAEDINKINDMKESAELAFIIEFTSRLKQHAYFNEIPTVEGGGSVPNRQEMVAYFRPEGMEFAITDDEKLYVMEKEGLPSMDVAKELNQEFHAGVKVRKSSDVAKIREEILQEQSGQKLRGIPNESQLSKGTDGSIPTDEAGKENTAPNGVVILPVAPLMVEGVAVTKSLKLIEAVSSHAGEREEASLETVGPHGGVMSGVEEVISSLEKSPALVQEKVVGLQEKEIGISELIHQERFSELLVIYQREKEGKKDLKRRIYAAISALLEAISTQPDRFTRVQAEKLMQFAELFINREATESEAGLTSAIAEFFQDLRDPMITRVPELGGVTNFFDRLDSTISALNVRISSGGVELNAFKEENARFEAKKAELKSLEARLETLNEKLEGQTKEIEASTQRKEFYKLGGLAAAAAQTQEALQDVQAQIESKIVELKQYDGQAPEKKEEELLRKMMGVAEQIAQVQAVKQETIERVNAALQWGKQQLIEMEV